MASLILACVACGSGSGSSGQAAASTPSAASTPHAGGSLTVLEGSGTESWQVLDPATDTADGLNWSYLDSVFGQLFEVGQDGKLQPDLATSYQFSDNNQTVTINLRQGVTFSDGTPFNAQAVAEDWTRVLSGNCSCKPTFLQKGEPAVRVVSPYAVSISFTYPNATFLYSLQSNPLNWIGSPTALKQMGEQAFALKPVGAGPFEVQSDTPGSQLTLVRNPHYWQPGRPYLNTLTFKLVSDDQAAYEALRAGSGQAYEAMDTPSLVSTFRKAGFGVTVEQSDTIMSVQLNTRVAPFNNISARRAVLYATDAALLDKRLFNDETPVTESFIEKGSLFYNGPTVPGYTGYNLAKAKALVKRLGGLSIHLLDNTAPAADLVLQALQSEWKQAGMKVTISSLDFAALEQQYFSLKWQAGVAYTGDLDPALSIGVNMRFGPADNGLFSGVEDPQLNAVLVKASEVTGAAARQQLYAEASKIIAQKAYGIFLFPVPDFTIVSRHFAGPGLSQSLPASTVSPHVLWEDVYQT